jgi:hypothetical protein
MNKRFNFECIECDASYTVIIEPIWDTKYCIQCGSTIEPPEDELNIEPLEDELDDDAEWNQLDDMDL